jgi:S-adenosylmethionine:tRNA ribosyltransferase-isomerase
MKSWKNRGVVDSTEEVSSRRSSLPSFQPSILPSLPSSLFDYHLPKELIAQEPLAERDRARLLVVSRQSGGIQHRVVSDLPDLLAPGDLLVLNNTRVLPARLYGVREKTGGKWEGLFLRRRKAGLWEVMGHARGRLTTGESIRVDAPLDTLRLRLAEKTPEGHWLVQPDLVGSAMELLERFGHVPLPPYIRKGHDQPGDRDRYQTVFAERPGAVAAPTAGLHFTPALLDRLAAARIERAWVTLHVGAGTFRPIEAENVADHRLHPEWAKLPQATVNAIHGCKKRGGRVVAVGTTCVRTLETAARLPPPLNKGGPGGVAISHAETKHLRAWSGETDLYIYPHFQFKIVDALLTNFHLPRSSLLVLASAFAGIDLLRRAYGIAISKRYRFYSYGDAMLIL